MINDNVEISNCFPKGTTSEDYIHWVQYDAFKKNYLNIILESHFIQEIAYYKI